LSRSLLAVFLVTLLLPAHLGRSSATNNLRLEVTSVSSPPLQAVEDFKSTLQSRGESLEHQGVLIETLDGCETLAAENPDSLFNPASVMKLATSLGALSKFGPDYRYETSILGDGYLDPKARRLEGDLVVAGGCDPMFALADVQELASRLSKLGVSRVTGSLRVAGSFYYFATGYHSNLSRETSAVKLRSALQRCGIKIEGPTTFGAAIGKPLLTHYSDRLTRILLFQNAHSSNAVAEVVGESVGGPSAIQQLLISEAGLRAGDVYVGRASGLDVNQISPRGSIKLLRALISSLQKSGLNLRDIMAVAGIDSGTLKTRLCQDGIRGAIIAKTGTLVSLDNGVSTLVGVASTRSRGLVLFAIFDSDGAVRGYRRVQDQLLAEFVKTEGGGVPFPALEDRLANNDRDTFFRVVSESAAASDQVGSE
jgi:D-alanyl-D-alanine carboxypeptidase/D-alanyl-D-alanine-endopeptidase (penicillin-binding protein 4)